MTKESQLFEAAPSTEDKKHDAGGILALSTAGVKITIGECHRETCHVQFRKPIEAGRPSERRVGIRRCTLTNSSRAYCGSTGIAPRSGDTAIDEAFLRTGSRVGILMDPAVRRPSSEVSSSASWSGRGMAWRRDPTISCTASKAASHAGRK